MGELTKTNTVSDWLTRIDASRNELIDAAKNGSRINAAFAMAEARVQLIESLTDENIKARLLRMTDPRINMVELANNPTDEDRIRVCAIAILSGFCPGDDQFAVFGGKGGGKLYTKEAGFRTLFAHLGIVPEVSVGHPEFVPLGKSGKKIWRVEGKASCSYGGKEYAVEFSGAMALGLPGYESDNVAGITAKGRRQLLKALWTKVSPILNDDHADEVEIIPQTLLIEEPQQVAEVATVAVDPEPSETEKHEPSLARIRKILGDNPDQLTFVESVWNEIAAAKTQERLEEAGKELAAMKASVSQQVLSLVRPYYQARQVELKGGAA